MPATADATSKAPTSLPTSKYVQCAGTCERLIIPGAPGTVQVWNSGQWTCSECADAVAEEDAASSSAAVINMFKTE